MTGESREDNVFVDQAWFWTEHWQQREREVDEHVRGGRVSVHESAEEFLAHLDALDDR